MQFDWLKRREFITLAGGATAWPLVARAQQPTTPVIGFLHSASPAASAHLVQSFHIGLKEAGFVEGQNIAIEYRWAEGHQDRMPALTADLASRQLAAIVTAGPSATYAAKAATKTLPIVFLVGTDPVRSGLVASFNQPGGNLTGVGVLINVLAPKQLELLHEVVPKVAAVAILVNPDSPNAETDAREVQEAAQTLGLRLVVLKYRTDSDIDAAFARLIREGVGGLILLSDPILNDRRYHIAALAARNAMPTIGPEGTFPRSGGLMSYGSSLADAFREIGNYAGKILKGAKPADLPIIQPTKFELVINLGTAKALGLTIPDKVLALADEVIE
jgi:putative tryptophan/tyrosine transport system substrate-binding protein